MLDITQQRTPSNKQEYRKFSYPERPRWFEPQNDVLKAYRISAPKGEDIKLEPSIRFLSMVSSIYTPISFEIIGTAEEIVIQWIVREQASSHFLSQFRSYFPNIAVSEISVPALPLNLDNPVAIMDMGLDEECMRPIETSQRLTSDPLIGIIATLEQLQHGECGMIQILFQGCQQAWGNILTDAVSDGQGGSFFSDAPEMVKLAQEKTSSVLFATVIRVIAQGNQELKGEQIASNIISSISNSSRSQYNQLISLNNKGYDYHAHLANVLKRRSNRLGMLLNAKELVTLAHIPSASVTSQKLSRQALKTKFAPKELFQGKYLLGTNSHLGQTHNIYLDDEYKKRHIYVIGNTGQGKSTLIVNMLLNDASVGNGGALFDPHGDVVDDVLALIPEDRKDDVIVFDPSDTEFPIGFNLLQAKTDIEKIVLSSDLVEVFKSRSTSWGDQMTSVLSNAVNAFLESDKGGTLLELQRFLLDPLFREQYLDSIEDYSIRSYWEHDFKQLKKGSISPLLTRLDTFLRPRIIRNMMAQKKGIDFHEVMNGKKILLVKLAQGLIGEENSYLLGTLMLAKLQQASQARATLPKDQRHPFYIYIDEFHNFITPSMSAILSGARKYGLGLVLANQQISQITSVSKAIADSVLSNPAVRICFRVGDNDAKQLANGFSFYEQNDLQNLERGQCIVRVGRNEHDFNLETKMFPNAINGEETTNYIINLTHKYYASTKAEVEEIVRKISQFGKEKQPKKNVAKEQDIEDAIIVSETTRESPPIVEVPKEEIIPPNDLEKEAQEFTEQHEQKREKKEHIYQQEHLSRLVQQRGFKAQLEAPTTHGGRIDLLVSKDNLKIAVEISVTNTVEYETNNIKKCIDEGFTYVVMLCKSETHLRNIKVKAQEALSQDELKRVQFLHPDKFIEYLDALTTKNTTHEKRVKGYRVKTKYDTSVDGVQRKEDIRKVVFKKNN